MKHGRRLPGRPVRDAGEGDALGDPVGIVCTALSDMISRLDPGGDGVVRRDIEFETGALRAQAGVRLRLAGLDLARPRGGTPRDARPVGTEKATQPDAEARPIKADVVDDGLFWRLTAEVPGVARRDLLLAIEDGVLRISAVAPGRRYTGSFALPSDTSRDALRVNLRNGILEIEAPSAGAARG
jgi:HSP20 family molecular chaperone IbpA